MYKTKNIRIRPESDKSTSDPRPKLSSTTPSRPCLPLLQAPFSEVLYSNALLSKLAPLQAPLQWESTTYRCSHRRTPTFYIGYSLHCCVSTAPPLMRNYLENPTVLMQCRPNIKEWGGGGGLLQWLPLWHLSPCPIFITT